MVDIPEKPRIRVPAGRRADAFRGATGGQAFEGASNGRRLRNFNPPRGHINTAIEQAGRTLVKRARYLVENSELAGNAVDVWAAHLIGEGIKPTVKLADRERRRALLSLWWRWCEEADADGITDFYGLQERIAREVYIAGECFVRLRRRRPGDMETVPLQLQLLPSEMLDVAYNEDFGGGNYVRMGIEFDPIGRRVAYHFWRQHPDDLQRPEGATLRTRVPAADVMHVFDARQGQQIRGASRFARVIVRLFTYDGYDDAELERKRVAALYAGFVKSADGGYADEEEDEDDEWLQPIQPGALMVLPPGKEMQFSSPADVGGQYEAFQYRTALRVAAGLGIPYAYLTGDTTRGNFSNVRTDIVNFRRKVAQFVNNVIIFQACRPVWRAWLDAASLKGAPELAGYEADPVPFRMAEWLPPKMEYVDPSKDVASDIKAIRAGLKTRTQAIAERGYDRDEVDEELRDEIEAADARGLALDTDPRRVSQAGVTQARPAGSGWPLPSEADDFDDNANEPPEADQGAPSPSGESQTQDGDE